MRSRRDFYSVLHVQPDAPSEIIRMSYRTLMQELKRHPDLGGDTGEAALINEAFATLRDPARRAAYDKALAGSPSAVPATRPAAPAPAAKPPARPRPGGKHMCPFCGELHAPQDASRPDSLCRRCQSPIFPAVQHARASGSGRAVDRAPRQMAVHVTLAGAGARAFDATTEDISIAGARVTSVIDLPIGQHLKLDCGFCTAVGIVRHVQPAPDQRPPHWHLGVEFVTLLIKQARGAFVSAQV
jgi:hypothetical protein